MLREDFSAGKLQLASEHKEQDLETLQVVYLEETNQPQEASVNQQQEVVDYLDKLSSHKTKAHSEQTQEDLEQPLREVDCLDNHKINHRISPLEHKAEVDSSGSNLKLNLQEDYLEISLSSNLHKDSSDNNSQQLKEDCLGPSLQDKEDCLEGLSHSSNNQVVEVSLDSLLLGLVVDYLAHNNRLNPKEECLEVLLKDSLNQEVVSLEEIKTLLEPEDSLELTLLSQLEEDSSVNRMLNNNLVEVYLEEQAHNLAPKEVVYSELSQQVVDSSGQEVLNQLQEEDSSEEQHKLTNLQQAVDSLALKLSHQQEVACLVLQLNQQQVVVYLVAMLSLQQVEDYLEEQLQVLVDQQGYLVLSPQHKEDSLALQQLLVVELDSLELKEQLELVVVFLVSQQPEVVCLVQLNQQARPLLSLEGQELSNGHSRLLQGVTLNKLNSLSKH